MWEKPWKVKEAIAIGAGLVITGILLQFCVGAVNWSLFAFPVNVVVLVALLLLVACGYAFSSRVYVLEFLVSGSSAIASIGYAATLTVVMGLVPQSAHPSGEVFGITNMLSWWPFVLVYFWLTLIVGIVGLRHAVLLVRGKKRSLATLLSHVGLFVAIVCSTLGNADVQRLKMSCKVGSPEWRAQDDGGKVVELPLAIELHEFSIEYYPMQVVIIDNATGKTVADSPWEVAMTKQMEYAAANVTDSVDVHYVEWHSVGATSAAYVEAVNKADGKSRQGWISCGSFAFPYHGLKLDDRHSAVMPEREPKRFASSVSVYTKAGETFSDTILVNKPLNVDGWKIYQLSYDEALGRWSDVSIFELVKDPWLPAVYCGIALMLVGAVLLFLNSGKKGVEQP